MDNTYTIRSVMLTLLYSSCRVAVFAVVGGAWSDHGPKVAMVTRVVLYLNFKALGCS
jgi:hypothetical protein